MAEIHLEKLELDFCVIVQICETNNETVVRGLKMKIK